MLRDAAVSVVDQPLWKPMSKNNPSNVARSHRRGRTLGGGQPLHRRRNRTLCVPYTNVVGVSVLREDARRERVAGWTRE